jgi:hypothetical protein
MLRRVRSRSPADAVLGPNVIACPLRIMPLELGIRLLIPLSSTLGTVGSTCHTPCAESTESSWQLKTIALAPPGSDCPSLFAGSLNRRGM